MMDLYSSRLKERFLSFQRNLWAVVLFVGLTVFMTYPIAFRMRDTVRDPGDPLLNSWIISWDIHSVLSGKLRHLFNANIYFPHDRTLAYSEHLFTEALIGLPVMLATGNPIFTYNFVLLFSLLTCGFGAFLLTRYLTGCTGAAVFSGAVFAFSPFMFAHLGHLQVLCAGGIPITLLFLHKFFRSEKWSYLFFFTLFYVLQVLANGYYALYSTVFCGLLILYHVVSQKRYGDFRFWSKMGLFSAVVTLTTGPFFYQYWMLRQKMGFIRSIDFSANLTNYLATSPVNRLYGSITGPFLDPEGALFPGLVPVLLTSTLLIGVVRSYWTPSGGESCTDFKISISFKWILNLSILSYLLLIAILSIFGGFNKTITVRATHLTNPILTLIFISAIRVSLIPSFRKTVVNILSNIDQHVIIYLTMLFLSIWFAFGKDGPYKLLYDFIPGFDGLRVASRFHIFTMLSLSVLSGYGLKYITDKIRGRKKLAVISLCVGAVLLEYFSAPLPLVRIPVGDKIPPVYQWLSGVQSDAVVLELPVYDSTPGSLPYTIEAPRVYYAAYHLKKLVNGYSGYHPPMMDELSRRIQLQPVKQTLTDFQRLGIDYVILHKNLYHPKEFSEVQSAFSSMGNRIRFIDHFGSAYVYALKKTNLLSDAGDHHRRYESLPRKNWRVLTNAHPELAPNAIDRNTTSRWHSGPQKDGLFFQLDMGSLQSVSGFSLFLEKNISDYPPGISVETSLDGKHWKTVLSNKKIRPSILSFIYPSNLEIRITFQSLPARYMKLTLTSSEPPYYWSIYDIDVFNEKIKKVKS